MIRMLPLVALVGCTEAPPEPLDFQTTAPPVEVGGSYAENLSCGPHERNAFDIYFDENLVDQPLLVYIHGGGFTQGDKSSLHEYRSDLVQWATDQGYAVATMNYRLLEENDAEGVIKPLSDSLYCLQYMRYHAGSFGIDPTNVVLMGSSAGAGTALWIAAADEMADPKADDPVERMSSRVNGAIAIETQATYDLERWTTDVFVDFGIDLMATAESFGLSELLWSFYGIDSNEAFYSEEIEAYRASVDMLDMLSADDPPIYLDNSMEGGGFPLSVGALYHHPNHALVVMERAEEVGVEHISWIPELDVEDPEGRDVTDFLRMTLGE